MTPIRSSKLSPSVESLRSFRPRPTETSSGSATSHSIVNAIWSSAAQALPRHRHTLRQACEKFPRRGAVGCRYNPPQLNTGPNSIVDGPAIGDPALFAPIRTGELALLLQSFAACTNAVRNALLQAE